MSPKKGTDSCRRRDSEPPHQEALREAEESIFVSLIPFLSTILIVLLDLTVGKKQLMPFFHVLKFYV